MGGQGPEHQAAVDAAVVVDALQGLHQVVLGDRLGQNEVAHLHAQSLGPLGGTPLIGDVVGLFAHPDDGEDGGHARLLQGGTLIQQPLAHGLGHGAAF